MLRELIFGSLHGFHVIQCASRNCTWETGIMCNEWDWELNREKLGEIILASLHKIYVMRSQSVQKKLSVSYLCNSQGRRKNPNPNCLVRIFSGGVGVFHVKGWGPKSSGCPSKPRETKLSGRISRDFAGISRGHPKSLRRKSLCSIFVH